MEQINVEFIKKKKLLMQINSGELNKSILYYINEARTCPQDFSRHLMVDDDVDDKISKLSLFFKYSSIRVPPLELNSNLEKSSNDLLYHIISIDDGSSELIFDEKEKERNNLNQRLKKFNLIPVYHADLIIIGVEDAIDALANIFINNNHRNKILSPDMKYIGISTGLLPSERLCIVIDIVSFFRCYNNYFSRAKNINYISSVNISDLLMLEVTKKMRMIITIMFIMTIVEKKIIKNSKRILIVLGHILIINIIQIKRKFVMLNFLILREDIDRILICKKN